MLSYPMSQRGDVPLYEYLYRCIRDDIVSGKLLPGEKLPGKRSLAQNLGVSVITVENAYGLLAAEGYVQAKPRSGFTVCDGIRSSTVPARQMLPPEPPQVRDKGETLTDVSRMRQDPDMFPFSVWSGILRELLADHREELMTPPPPQGLYRLRRAIADHLREWRGMPVSPEQIVIGAGSEQLYTQLAQLMGSGRVWGLEDPCFEKTARIYTSCGVTCRFFPVDGEGLRTELLESGGVQTMHVTPGHHYPTGRILSAARRGELLRWAHAESRSEPGPRYRDPVGRYVVEDDYDGEFHLQGRAVPTLYSADPDGRVIYMNTFTRTLASTVRISYMVLPFPLMERWRSRLGFFASPVSAFEQYALSLFLERGHFGRQLNRLRTVCRARRQTLTSALRNSSTRTCLYLEDAGGLYLLLHADTSMPDDEAEKRMAEKGIRIRPLSSYCRGESQESHAFVVAAGGLDETVSHRLVDAFGDLIRNA